MTKGAPRKPVVFLKPPVAGGLCWHCDKKLYASGRAYVMVRIDDVLRPVHACCAKKVRR